MIPDLLMGFMGLGSLSHLLKRFLNVGDENIDISLPYNINIFRLRGECDEACGGILITLPSHLMQTMNLEGSMAFQFSFNYKYCIWSIDLN